MACFNLFVGFSRGALLALLCWMGCEPTSEARRYRKKYSKPYTSHNNLESSTASEWLSKLQELWPTKAVARLTHLMEATSTHHRHYFRPEDLRQENPKVAVFSWILKELQNQSQIQGSFPGKKSYAPISCFLVAPREASSFFLYMDQSIKDGAVRIINCQKEEAGYITFLLSFFPSFKDRTFGLSFYQGMDSRSPSLVRISEAPYLKLVFSADGTLVTAYPTPGSILIPMEDSIVNQLLLELKNIETGQD